jgi:prepilin-type N-terminal cleavage/methylation domain-containing protein
MSQRHHGFTLIELLVVTAMIAALMALFVPAVQQAREAARRAQCKNNLKQLGLALHNYHDAHRALPPGYLYRRHPQGNAAGFGWGCMILPLLEQPGVYQEFDWNVALHAAANQLPRERHLAAFLCPSDPVSDGGFVLMGPAPERYAMASYVACFGPPDLDQNQQQRWGLFSRNSRTRFADVTDGLSQTLMVGERVNGPFRSGRQIGNHFEYDTTWAGAVRDAADPGDDHGHMALFQTGHVPNDPWSDDRDVSAPHVGLAQFLLGDGSVRALSENIDFNLYTALGTRASSDAIGEF